MVADASNLKRRGLMLILSSPSGAGKSSISRSLIEEERERMLKRKTDNEAIILQPCCEYPNRRCRKGDDCKYVHAFRH